jgi:hypothetical protein
VATDVEDWKLAHTAAIRVFERIQSDNADAAMVRRQAADIDRRACRALGDKAGEGMAIIHSLQVKDELMILGERRSEIAARLDRRLALVAEARQLLGEDSRIVLDNLELEVRIYQPLPDRLPLLLGALSNVSSQGKASIIEKHRDQALTDLEIAIREGAIAAWTPASRAAALQLWQTRMDEVDPNINAVEAALRAQAIINRLHTQRIAKILAGEPLPVGLPRELIEAVRHLPSPSESDDVAMAWLAFSGEAEKLDPEEGSWLKWARSAYSGRPGILAYNQNEE